MNKREKFTYKMIETTVGKGLKYIEENGNRGVRYFIDLGEHFSKGKFQKMFFETAKKMLSDENSKYYTIAQKTIHTVDHRILKKFGINLGYNSLTYGTKLIRENEQVFEQNIPWSIIFDFEKTEYTVNSTDLSEFLCVCESLGIFCCHFFAGDNKNALDEVLPILKEHEDSSYFIFAEPQSVSDEMIDIISDAGNIAIVLRYETDKDHSPYVLVLEKLNNKKCIYGIYSVYDEENVHYILSKENLTAYQASCSTFIYFVRKEKLNKTINNQFVNSLKLINNQNEYQMYFIDFYEQISYMDHIVSSQNTIISIDGEGQICAAIDNNLENMNLNIKTHSMFEILNEISPEKPI